MNKKAMSVLMVIFELLVVSIVIYSTVRVAHAYGSSLISQEVNLAEDVRMMINTLGSVPGDAIVTYPGNASKFRLVLSQNGVSVFKEGDLPNQYVKRTFFLPQGYSAQGVVKETAHFCLQKTGKIILLSDKCEEKVTEKVEVKCGEVSAETAKKFALGFLDKVKEVANGLGMDPNYILAVMSFETGNTFDPCVKNPVSSATGLIQFMSSTAIGLGTTTESLCQMSQVEQMDYVKKYFELNGGKKAKTLSDTYMVVLYPNAVGKPESYVLFESPSKAYEQNSGLDKNKDNKVTKEEAAAKVKEAYGSIVEKECPKEAIAGPSFYGIPIEGDRVVFVVDHSGSMRVNLEGDFQVEAGIENRKIDVAKWQLKSAILGMPDGKEVNIIFFDSSINLFKSNMVELSSSSREEINSFIDPFEPGTGTNTGEALEKALSLGNIDSIYLLTDGMPDQPYQLIVNKIKNLNAAKKVKINTIGIFSKGSEELSKYQQEIIEKERAEGTEFLRQLAEDSGGVFVIQN
ncbi:MAG: VWA domain-containing protein [Nanoarchaeota archaeon]|nr:VWA domain-containing protein [Nanoarchaeota archaeon]MBU1644695.1 VWA domain-containing protein [Nanoarchaeota archaeon]MBU1977408.1 VWA domain-containing protein [Nanoarchaeota archaeon]